MLGCVRRGDPFRVPALAGVKATTDHCGLSLPGGGVASPRTRQRWLAASLPRPVPRADGVSDGVSEPASFQLSLELFLRREELSPCESL